MSKVQGVVKVRQFKKFEMQNQPQYFFCDPGFGRTLARDNGRVGDWSDREKVSAEFDKGAAALEPSTSGIPMWNLGRKSNRTSFEN